MHNFRIDFLKILLPNLKAMEKIRFSPKAIYFPFRTVIINVKIFIAHMFALENFQHMNIHRKNETERS